MNTITLETTITKPKPIRALNMQEISAEVKMRKADGNIRQRIDHYIETTYGLKNYSEIADGQLGHTPDQLQICLGRQQLTPNIEIIGTVELVRLMNKHGLWRNN